MVALHSHPVSKDAQSVLNALDVLEFLMREDEVNVSDIAPRLGISESTVHRLLSAMCARNLAERNPDTGLYRLGVHLAELGRVASDRFPLRRAALPLLQELQQASGLSVHLTVPDGTDVVFVERLKCVTGIGLTTDSGRRMPSHATSAGKALAAFDPAFAQARKAAGFPRVAPRTISAAADFDRALAEVRRTGVAISVGESQCQLTSVAAPVRDFCGRAYAAISVVGPEPEFGDFGRAARLVITATAKLGQALGRLSSAPSRRPCASATAASGASGPAVGFRLAAPDNRRGSSLATFLGNSHFNV
jgi:DNA-binding IclR family transcriptional regulator